MTPINMVKNSFIIFLIPVNNKKVTLKKSPTIAIKENWPFMIYF